MLPNLAGLDLTAHKGAETGEFYQLDADEAAHLDARDIRNLISYAPLAAGDEHTFCVAMKKDIDPNDLERYHWYDGRDLWAWARTNQLDPLHRPWWYEDWWGLHYRYDPNGAVPDWVRNLPRLGDGSVTFYAAGPSSNAPMRRKVWPGGATILYAGRPHREHMVQRRDAAGQVDYFQGPKDQEHIVRRHGRYYTTFYAGPKGEERKWLKQTPMGFHDFYEGPKGKERLVRSVDSDSTVTFYEGPQNAERVVRREYDLLGLVAYYKGPKGEERMVRKEWTEGLVSGEVWYLNGKKDEEHLVRKELPNGDIIWYTGPQGDEVESSRSTAAERKEEQVEDYQDYLHVSTLSSYD